MNLSQIIKRPLLTEKTTDLQSQIGYYSLEVDRRATKTEIKKALEKFYSVHVVNIKTQNRAGKTRKINWRFKTKLGDWKKALIKLKAGEKIPAFEIAKEKEKEKNEKP